MIRDIEELRSIAIEMGKPLDKLLYEMLTDAMNENQELKEKLEDMTLCRDIASGHRKEVQDRETILLNQQKEFIKYLENEIDRLEKTEFYIDSIQKAAIETHKHNLSKYQEIIGQQDGQVSGQV